MADAVQFRSAAGRIVYQDSRDHFENGLLRLLHLTLPEFQRWLDLAEQQGEVLLPSLTAGFQKLRPLPAAPVVAGAPVDDGPEGQPGYLLLPAIAESPGFGVACAGDRSIGWLVRFDGQRWRRELAPPVYEEAYFEGDPMRAGGYGDYQAQSAWRLEKSRRQVRELKEWAGLGAGQRVLDLGSGYGFFRQALAEAGIEHDGLEISAHARAVAQRLYGFPSLSGTLADHRDALARRYDLITLFDMLEHVAQPRTLLADVASCLKPGGVVAIKTPNIDCPERDVFGPHYHSLKREHLVYYSASGLKTAAASVGLTQVHGSSASHLLVGFVGEQTTAQWVDAARGADLVACFRKPLAAASALPSGR
jgi:2-polyprenyl-3-methyl-5-hydroxy-6-metoxy-1,4-benzoquinol methylase